MPRQPLRKLMPIYDYKCQACKRRFELLVMPGHPAVCPTCGSADLARMFSGAAAVSTTRSRERAMAGARSKAKSVKREKDHAHSEYMRNHIKNHS